MEQVLVVDRKALEALLAGETLITGNIEPIRQFILSHHFFMERDKAEYDNTVKQIIPYVILRRKDEVFLLRRLKKQSEARLHDKLSIGVGGHINPNDETGFSDIIEASLHRELSEEVSIVGTHTLHCVGILNENNGGVSDYHAALLYSLEIDGTATVLETEKMEGHWIPQKELDSHLKSLETWSKIAANSLF